MAVSPSVGGAPSDQLHQRTPDLRCDRKEVHEVLANRECDAVAALRITLIQHSSVQAIRTLASFSDAVVPNSFGDVAEDLSEL